MKKNFPKKRLFVLALAVVYFAIIAAVWIFQNRAASVDLTDLLQCSVDAAIDTIDYNVEPEALRVARAIVHMFGRSENATNEELVRLAKVFETQEINVADRNGVIIASNLKENLGFDFKKSEQTSDFAALSSIHTLSERNPLVVEPEHPHWMATYISRSIEKTGQELVSVMAKPVVEMVETTSKKLFLKASKKPSAAPKARILAVTAIVTTNIVER